MAIERRQHVMGQRDGDGRLADPAGASERDEAIAQQASRQFLQNVLASDHPLQAVRQRNRRGSLLERPVDGDRRRRHAALHGRDKAISPAGNVRDVARTVFSITERLTQFGDVDPQTDFLDHEAGPRIGENFLLRNHLTRATDQQPQDIGCPAPQLDRHTVLLEQPRPEGERSELHGFNLVSSSCSHSRECPRLPTRSPLAGPWSVSDGIQPARLRRRLPFFEQSCSNSRPFGPSEHSRYEACGRGRDSMSAALHKL